MMDLLESKTSDMCRAIQHHWNIIGLVRELKLRIISECQDGLPIIRMKRPSFVLLEVRLWGEQAN